MTQPFFCISYFDGDLSWVESLCGKDYVIYAKGILDDNAPKNVIMIPNIGYNIYSYLTFIIDNYETLPELTVFCKNNVFDRHVSKSLFKNLCTRKTFTPIEEPSRWKKIAFPASVISSDGGYLELNNSWYANKYDRRYFHSFDSYYNFVFKDTRRPDYLRFAPGANYLVPRDHILLRSKNFYINLREFVAHSQYSCESHFVERSLISIWSSNLQESPSMSKIISFENLEELSRNCFSKISHERNFSGKIKRKAMIYLTSFCNSIFSSRDH